MQREASVYTHILLNIAVLDITAMVLIKSDNKKIIMFCGHVYVTRYKEDHAQINVMCAG